MIKILSSLLGGVYGYAAIALCAGAAASYGTYYIVHNKDQNKILAIELAASKQQSADVSLSLAKLQGFISTANIAATDYGNTVRAIDTQVGFIVKGLNDAIKAKPLPADCKPDASRLRSLQAAVDAAGHSTDTGTSP